MLAGRSFAPGGCCRCSVSGSAWSSAWFAQIDLRATALAGMVVLVTLIVAWLVALTRGQNGNPYDWLLAISGLSYLLAIAFFRWRG
jgi:amino acid permease